MRQSRGGALREKQESGGQVIPADKLYQQAVDACERDDHTGICRVCGHEEQGHEPDARGRLCEECGAEEIYGAELIMITQGSAR